jgi:leader peptidase (prepilin peptidase) / N-methyltransferase
MELGQAIVFGFFATVLLVLAIVDARTRLLPNRIVLPATAVVLAAQLAFFPERWLEWVVAALGASLFLLAAALAYPGGMGMGDVKLAFFLGAALGRSVGVALMIGMLTALVPSVALLVRHGSAARRMTIPFGPFLALGAIVTLFVGDPADLI